MGCYRSRRAVRPGRAGVCDAGRRGPFLPGGWTGHQRQLNRRDTHPLPGLSAYSATKAALEALTRVWAVELGASGITVNAVAPGPVDTAMLRAGAVRMGEEAVKGMVARTPLGRLGTPSDVADVVAFLASPDARWVTGQVIETSGGINP